MNAMDFLSLELKCSVLLILAGLLTTILRKISASQRHMIWSLAMLGAVIIPLVCLSFPQFKLAVLPEHTTAPSWVQPQTPTAVAPATSVANSAPTLPVVESEAVAASPQSNPLSLSQWMSLIWGAGLVIVLLPLLVGHAAVQRIVRRSRPASGDWLGLQEHLQKQLSIKRKVTVLEASGAQMPMALGLTRSSIVLPGNGREWSEKEREAVLAHELAHVKRRDCLIHFISSISLALHWFNPLAWYAMRRMRLEREHACDDYVLRAGAEPEVYADHLLTIARTLPCRLPVLGAAITMARKNALEGRLLAILDGARNRKALSIGVIATALLLTLGIATPLAALTSASDPNKGMILPSATVDLKTPLYLGENSLIEVDFKDFSPTNLTEVVIISRFPNGEIKEKMEAKHADILFMEDGKCMLTMYEFQKTAYDSSGSRCGDFIEARVLPIVLDTKALGLPPINGKREQAVLPKSSDASEMGMAERAMWLPETESGWCLYAVLEDGAAGNMKLPMANPTDAEKMLAIDPMRSLSSKYIGLSALSNGPTGYGVQMEMTEEGREKLEELTASCIGQRLAVVFNGKILIAPRVEEKISDGQMNLTGQIDQQDLFQMMSAFGAGPAVMEGLYFYVVTSDAPMNSVALPLMKPAGKEKELRIDAEIRLSSDDIKSASVESSGSYPRIMLDLTDEGAVKFEELTASIVGKRLAIVLDGIILTAPKVMERISGGRAAITGQFKENELKQLLERIAAAGIEVRTDSNAVDPVMLEGRWAGEHEGIGLTLTLDSGGRLFLAASDGNTLKGSWEIKGNDLLFHGLGDEVAKGILEGGKLTVEEGNEFVVFTRMVFSDKASLSVKALGTWVMTQPQQVIMHVKEGGVLTGEAEGQQLVGTWEDTADGGIALNFPGQDLGKGKVVGNKMTVRAAGDVLVFTRTAKEEKAPAPIEGAVDQLKNAGTSGSGNISDYCGAWAQQGSQMPGLGLLLRADGTLRVFAFLGESVGQWELTKDGVALSFPGEDPIHARLISGQLIIDDSGDITKLERVEIPEEERAWFEQSAGAGNKVVAPVSENKLKPQDVIGRWSASFEDAKGTYVFLEGGVLYMYEKESAPTVGEWQIKGDRLLLFYNEEELGSAKLLDGMFVVKLNSYPNCQLILKREKETAPALNMPNPFLGEWEALNRYAEPDGRMQLRVEASGSALIYGLDTRMRAKWSINIDELVLETKADGTMTADINESGYLVLRSGGKAVMEMKRPGAADNSVADAPVIEPLHQLSARLKAAGSIASSSERDAAMYALAVDAAALRATSVALKAINQISSSSSRDEAAQRVAKIYVEFSLISDATAVSKLISSSSIRDYVLRMIAAGPTAPVTAVQSAQVQVVVHDDFERLCQGWNVRIEAANRIMMISDRDSALAAIACDAAAYHAVEPTLKALKGITMISSRDDAAKAAAIPFIHSGYSADAMRIAETMVMHSDKKEVLEMIAKGCPSGAAIQHHRPGTTTESHYNVEVTPGGVTVNGNLNPENMGHVVETMGAMAPQMMDQMVPMVENVTGSMQGTSKDMQRSMKKMQKEMQKAQCEMQKAMRGM